MAQIEPMDIESDFEDKENSIKHSNVLPKSPCTEKGYEELDVSELSMKLRYSITPASSPMSKSYSTSCRDNTASENIKNDNILSSNNLTNSLNSTLTYDSKLNKMYPLQPLLKDIVVDLNGNPLLRRSLDIDSNVASIVNENHLDEHLSLPSTSSSATHTPDATTPTKEMPKDGGSPIMRGLKSVFSMFRSSQSPIPPADADVSAQKNLSPTLGCPTEICQSNHLVSTPTAKNKESLSRRNSPLKDSVVFKDDLEKELQWKEETTIIFKDEKIPIHKLFSQQPPLNYLAPTHSTGTNVEQNITVEYMDISQNEIVISDKTMTDDIEVGNTTVTGSINAVESDGEFVDCETTITKIDLDISEANIDDLTSLIESSNYLKAKEKSSLEFLGDIKEMDAVDALTGCNAILYNNQSREKIIERNIESASISNGQQYATETCDNHEDSIVSMLGFPDSANLPVHGNDFESHMIISKNNDDATDENENVPDEYKTQECAKVTDEKIELIVINEHENSYDIMNKSYNQNNSSIDTNIVIDAGSISINEVGNEALDVSTIDRNQALDIILNDSKNITNLNTEDSNSNKMLSEEINKNNLYSTIEMNLIDNLPEEALNEKSDVQSTIMNTNQNMQNVVMSSDKSCDKETIKLNDSINDNIEKSKMNLICSGNRTIDLSQSELTPMVEKNTQHIEITNDNEATEDINNICMMSKLATQIADFNRLKTNSENTNLPSDIPLPSDNELEQESGREIIPEETTNSSINLGSATNLGYTDVVEQIIDNNTEERLQFLEKYVETDELHADFDVKEIISAPLNSEDIDRSFNIYSQHYKDGISDVVTDNVNNADLTVINSNMTDDTYKNNCGINDNFNCTFSQNVNDNYTIVSKSNVKIDDTISVKTDKNNSINSMNLPDTSESTLNVLDDQPKIDYDEEIITSASSSPYVSVTEMAISSIDQDEIILEQPENPLETETITSASPPISPKLVNKRYNFNFDDIADPFATKTKIRLSPTPDSPKQHIILPKSQEKSKKKSNVQKRESQKNKRKSQTERRSLSTLNSFNRTFNAISKDNEHKQALDNINHTYNTGQDKTLENSEVNDVQKKLIPTQILDDCKQQDTEMPAAIGECCDAVDQFQSIQAKYIDSSTQCITAQPDIIAENLLALSCVFEATSDNHITETAKKMSLSISDAHSSHDKNKAEVKYSMVTEQSKQADTNECQKVTKESSPYINNVKFLPNKIESAVRDISDDQEDKKECSPNISVATSSKITNENHTVREIHTEDEDTVEGPFLETDLHLDGDLDHTNVFKDFAFSKDMMQFDCGDAVKKDENVDNGELFIDAETFDFLLNQNKSTVIADSGKESLFLKFDPLYAKRVSSEGVLAALTNIQKMQSTPKKITTTSNVDVNTELPSSSKSDINSEECREDPDLLSTSKPMMVVNPAVNPIVVARKISTPKLNRHSLTFTSPAIAVIDRLLSLSGNTSFMEQNTSLPQTSNEPSETDVAITQLREMLAEKESHVHNLRTESKELKDRISSLESQMKSLETESQQRLKKVNDLNERLVVKTKINKSMAVVVEEYERTIASLITEMEQEKKYNSEERIQLVKERDEQTAHLANMEGSFNDLHSKYEKSKQIILSLKANQDTYMKSFQDFEDNSLKMQNNYELLKQHATSKLNHANQELEKFNKAHESEVLKLNALIKRKEMHITSLEETLSQKTKANEELTAICDELINKVG